MVGPLISLHFSASPADFLAQPVSLSCTEHALASKSHEEIRCGQQQCKVSPYAK